MSSTAAAPRFVTVRRWWAWLGDLVRPASDAVRAGTECVSTLGWTVAVFGVVALASLIVKWLVRFRILKYLCLHAAHHGPWLHGLPS